MKQSALLIITLYQYTLSCYSTSLSINQYHFISHVFEHLDFITELKNPFLVELYILSGVTVFFWSNVIRTGPMPIYVSTLLNVPHISYSAADDTTLRIFLHYVWIVPFSLGGGLNGSCEGESLR